MKLGALPADGIETGVCEIIPFESTENVRVKGDAERFSLTHKSLIDRPLPECCITMEFPSQANDPLGSRISSAYRVQAREA